LATWGILIIASKIRLLTKIVLYNRVSGKKRPFLFTYEQKDNIFTEV